jgi:glycosyltransferase involved in cell wall biosynthesis
MTQYFPPEITAPAVRLHAISAGLADRGHEVEVVCEVPNHPRGIVYPGYGGRLVDRRPVEGFEVHYVWVRASQSKSAHARVASYGSYAAMASLIGSLRRPPDVVFASSPPLPVGAAALVVAKRHRVRWALDVRDLWPEFAVALGELHSPRLIGAAEWLERKLYASASLITTPTEPFRDHIAAVSGEPEKIVVLPNGTTREWLALGETAPVRAELNLPDDRFVWAYVGNIGLAQDVGNAVLAASLLDDGFQLLVVGDGPHRAEVEELAASLPDGAVRLTGLVEPDEAARYMRAADALLVSLVADHAVGGAVPSKLYDSCAVGRPVLVATPGEPRRIAERHGVALPVVPGDPAALAAAVRRLRDDAALRKRLTLAGRAFAADHLRDRQTARLEMLLQGLV